MTKSRKPRGHSSQERETFLALFEELQSNTATARALGLDPARTYNWLRQAGLKGKGRPGRSPHPRRDDYFLLRASGLTRREASTQVGVNYRTAGDWDRGTRRTGKRRVFADGRVVDYTTGMTTYTDQTAVAERPLFDRLQKSLHPRLLSLEERERIGDLVREGHSIRQIAQALDRAPSTVSREISRNSASSGYHPYAAHRKAATRRPRPKPRKLVKIERLRDYVQDRLTALWSPDQISRSLPVEFPADQEMRVTHETIYQALSSPRAGQFHRDLTLALRTGRARRVPRRQTQRRRPRFTVPMVMISERPAEAEDRAVPGHWEGDLIIGKDQKSAIGTLVERSSRYVLLVHLPSDHGAESLRDALTTTFRLLPTALRGSLTWDQGSEMAQHKAFTEATGIQVYFCEPASPWQRGSNENTNGPLRQYFPKGSELSVHSPEELARVAHELNNRPRKVLGWEAPARRLSKLVESRRR